MKKILRKHKAFTLIEMVIVLFIISLLLLIIIPNINKQKKSAQSKTDDAFRTTLQTQLDMSDGANSFKELEDQGYLSSSQVDKASKSGYKINGGVVEK